MKNSDYWKMRFAQLETAQNRKGAEAYAEIERQYRQAQKEIEGKIDAWYRRFADNNGVSMAEARRMLTARELAELKWDVNDYIRHGKENAVDQKWMKELENASARFHIYRLEALKLQTQHSLEIMFGNQLDSVDTAMKHIFLDGYYHTAYEIQKGFGIGWDIAGLDQRQIEKVIMKPWAADGKNFSERIWGNKEKLISEVHNELTRNIMLGQDPQKAIDAIAKKMNTSKYNAGRLVMTEEAYFSSAAQKDCFNDLDVEQYEIVATLDSHTSEICQEMDGKVFPMKDFEPGVTAPPFHVYCRSTTIPHFDNDFGQPGERAARGEDVKTYYVPADMTYQEWKKSFVDGGDKSRLQNMSGGEPERSAQQKKVPDKIMDSLPQFDKIQSESDLQNFSEKLIENLGIDRTSIIIQLEDLSGASGKCEMDLSRPADLLVKCKYNEYKLARNDGRSMEYRVKTAFHESYHLSLNGRGWDALNENFVVNSYWKEMEDTFAESSAHYMLERYGVTKKLMPSYPDIIARNLPRLKQLDEFKGCETIQDFGKIAFETRQNGGDGVWMQMYSRMQEVKLDKKYDMQYFDYIREHEDDLFSMICENVTGLEDFKDSTITSLHDEMNLVENTGVQPDSESIYYWFMSCAMQLKGVK